MPEREQPSVESGHDEVEGTPVLVPVDEDAGIYLVRGAEVTRIVDRFDGMDVAWLEGDRGIKLDEALAFGASAANIGLQAANAAHQVTGLVRLAPETTAAMRAGAQPLVSNGQYLGTLAKNGQIVAQVRFLPAGAVGAVPVLAALGPAMAVAAMQLQLAAIGRDVRENIRLTKLVLDDLREEAWFELEAACDVMHEEALLAMRTGVLTSHQWEYIQAQSSLALLRKHQMRRYHALLRTVRELALLDSPQDWLAANFETVMEAVRGLMLTARAAALHSTLRAVHIRSLDAEHGEELAKEVMSRADQESQRSLSGLEELVRELHMRLAVRREVDPGARFRIRRASREITVDRAVAHVNDALRQLQARHGDSEENVGENATVGTAEFLAVPADVMTRLRNQLRWICDDQRVHLVVWGEHVWDESKPYHLLVVGESQAFLVENDGLKRGVVRRQLLPGELHVEGRRSGKHELVTISGDDRVGALRVAHEQGTRVRTALSSLTKRQSLRSSELAQV